MNRSINSLPFAAASLILMLAVSVRGQDSIQLRSAPGSLNVDGAPDFAEGVQNVVGNPSPGNTGRTTVTTGPAGELLSTAFGSGSNLDNYLHQDEQINISPSDGVVAVLRTNQKSLIQAFVTRVYEVKNANPRELVGLFRVICGKEGGRAEVLFGAGGKKYIQVICPRFQLPYIRQVISIMDKEWIGEYDDGGTDLYYSARFRDVATVNALALDAGTPDQAAITVDPVANSVHVLDSGGVTADGEGFGSLGGYLGIAREVDIPVHQARFEVTVYELNVSNDLKLGLDYIAWKNGPGAALWRFVLAGSKITSRLDLGEPTHAVTNDHTSISQEFFSANALLTTAYMDFLQSKGEAKVVTSASVLTTSGRTGHFERIDQIVSFEAGEVDLPSDRGGFPPSPPGTQRTLNYNNTGKVGFFLDITPAIGTESMEVFVEAAIADLSGFTPQGLPIINTRTLSTTVRLRDGQTVVLGGLTRNEKVKQHQGMPWLSRIPVLGYLFGGETSIDRENDVLIVITPEVSLGAQRDNGVVRLADARLDSSTLAHMDQANDEASLPVPNNPFGFDMWLLDGE